jgi:hypothetical protein
MQIKDEECAIIFSDLVDLKEEIVQLKKGMDSILQHFGIHPVVSANK